MLINADYLAKPFKAKELLIRVHTQLQKAVFMKKLETRVEERTKALIETRQSFELLCERLPVGVSRFKPSMPVFYQIYLLTPGVTHIRDTNFSVTNSLVNTSSFKSYRLLT
jgi:response regulator RpfG family c-di-GMP phosphodiesterase